MSRHHSHPGTWPHPPRFGVYIPKFMREIIEDSRGGRAARAKRKSPHNTYRCSFTLAGKQLHTVRWSDWVLQELAAVLPPAIPGLPRPGGDDPLTP